MALAECVLQIVEEAARREGLRRVRAVWLEIGQLSSVEPEAMHFCFDAVTRDSIAAGARLEIIVTQGAAWCMACSERVALAELSGACPRCSGYQLRVIEGAEMRVKELEAE
jgi:hydrogenase nickel incorporation protein HypA/HybF